MGHREDIRGYLERLTVSGLVIDWGSGSKPVKKYVKGNAKFYGIDKNPDVDPEYLRDIELPTEVGRLADYAFCMEVLEHTTDPLQVLKNIHNNLKVGGVLHLSVPFLYPEHGEEDYLRFTRHGLKYYAGAAGFKDIKVWEIEQGYLMEATK